MKLLEFCSISSHVVARFFVEVSHVDLHSVFFTYKEVFHNLLFIEHQEVGHLLGQHQCGLLVMSECEVCLLNLLLVATLYHIMSIVTTRVTLDHARILLGGWHRHGFLRYCCGLLYRYICDHDRGHALDLYFSCCVCHVPLYLKKKNQPHFF